jgi:putative transposase
MKRHRRNIHESGHAHELTFSCYHGFPFLKSDRCCQWLCEAINESRETYRYSLWAYVFMPDHVHMIIYPHDEKPDLGNIKRSIKGPVGTKAIQYLQEHSPEWLDKITRQRGDRTERLFWQSGGGYDRNVTSPAMLLKMIDYIHANPVRKGLVETPSDWKWSSSGWFDDETDGPLHLDPVPKDWLE